MAIELRDGESYAPAAAAGKPRENPLFLPLTYQGEQVGRMVVGHRGTHQPFSGVDMRLLADIARQAGVAAHAVRLTADLQRSRERLVTTREEERRRLRRDLHDGLGAALAGVVLQMSAARTLLVRDPDAAAQLLDKLRVEVQDAITDIRRLVYDLLGFRRSWTSWARRGDSGACVAPHGQRVRRFPTARPASEHDCRRDAHLAASLQAAVEVAAYRIAAEALTNIVRHAEADELRLAPRVPGHARTGDTRRRAGLSSGQAPRVGLMLMRERAAELGGDLRIESALDRGTVIHAELPVHWRDTRSGNR